MAYSRTDLLFVLGGWLALASAGIAQERVRCPLALDARSATLEGGRTYRVLAPRIAGTCLTIEADEAVTRSLELDRRWELTGSIRMSVGSVELTASSAVFEFRAGELLNAEMDDPELYEERSPTTHVENLDAPLLIVHGVNDPRVPVSQARLLRDELEVES